MRRALPLLALLPLAQCSPKGDYTPQIAVSPEAAGRIILIPSRRAPGAAAPRGPARVHVMVAGEELGGPNAVGKPGDLLLENDEVAFVIDQLGSSSGFAESGGNVVDAADAKERKDELGQIFTYFGTFPRQGVYEAMRSGTGADGSAIVEVSGHELYEPKIKVTTRYTLSKDDRALLIQTTLKNEGDRQVDKLALGDAIQWGGAEKFAPGKAVGFKGPSSGPFIGGIGRHTSYAITSTEGAIDAMSGGSWSDTVQQKDVTLKSGEGARYERVFLVGERADAASVVSELTKSAGAPVGVLELGLVDGAGKPLRAPSGAKAVISTLSGVDLMSIVAMREGDTFGGEVPPGKYLVSYAAGGGRRAAGAKVPIEIAPDKATRASLVVSGAGKLVLACSELRAADDGTQSRARVPCKATLEGLLGTATPDFGSAHVAGPAKNQVTFDGSPIELLLSPGKYDVTLSRGMEYGAVRIGVEVKEGETASPCEQGDRCTLERVVDTHGYVATDFHQHSMLGADAPVALRDRVIANAAEGVEIAVASEHNVIADLEPIVRELGLASFLVQIPGDEVTTDAAKKPWGHANVYPLERDPTKTRGGAFVVGNRSARDIFAEARASAEPRVIQVNHPRTGITGYFDQLAFDPATGLGKDPGYDPAFDALEVWNGRNVGGRDKVLADYFALLRTRHPVTATADTDTHGIVGQEAGFPRTYVRVKDDRHLDAWDKARTQDLVSGVRVLRDVVLTNGPFLRATANGAPIGAIARAKLRGPREAGVKQEGSVELRVHIECAPWIVVGRVRVVRASGAEGAERSVTLTPLPSGARGADVTFALASRTDDAFVVVASGTAPMSPVFSGDPAELAPFAMTGAFWIDGDGDGKSLGR